MDFVKRSVRLFRAIGRGATTLAATAAAVLALGAGTAERTHASGDVRSITIFNIHTNETTELVFKRDGQWVPGFQEKFDHAFRDWRKSQTTHMDPALLDLLYEIHEELGSKVPIQLICGYRSRDTNEMLRKTVGGQASESRHILGKAADVTFPDVPLKALRYSAMIRERGGVGYYPTSAIPFVHVDTDHVRSWPNMPRPELALLFPGGHSQHRTADGGYITTADVRDARANHPELATQLANYFDSRAGRRPSVAVAGLDKVIPAAPAGVSGGHIQMASYEPPRLIEAPRLLDRPSQFRAPAAHDQARLEDLIQRASFTPAHDAAPRLLAPPTPVTRAHPAEAAAAAVLPPRAVAAAASFVAAPDFDEDHPDELDYRPFAVAPLLTLTASADDPALLALVHPDVTRTLELIDQEGTVPPMRLRPTVEVAGRMWEQQFTGRAVNFAALWEDGRAVVPGSGAAMIDRRVRTQ